MRGFAHIAIKTLAEMPLPARVNVVIKAVQHGQFNRRGQSAQVI